MNATLLCPGPSLARYCGQGAGIIVGVNRAVEAHACDVWAATDWPLIDRVYPLGRPTLFTIGATRDSLIRKGRGWPYQVVTHGDVAGGTVTNTEHPWTRYTATAALRYLAWTGATHVDVWGCNWAGQEDWDGNNTERSRTRDRWRDEQAIWQGVIDTTGLSVKRH